MKKCAVVSCKGLSEGGRPLCFEHRLSWAGSPENERGTTDARGRTAFMDWLNRIEAEERNGGGDA